MSTVVELPPLPLAEDIAETRSLLGSALERDFAKLPHLGPTAPTDAIGWHQLLGDFARHRSPHLADLVQRAAADGLVTTAGTIERYACLQAFQLGLARLAELALADPVKRLYCAVGRQVAEADPALAGWFHHASQTLYQLANVATLTWFPAGQLAFQFTRFPRSWLLKVHPLALPGLLHELTVGFGGRPPMAAAHLWSWRSNPFLVLPGEHERSLWRIARTLALRPEIGGLMADSWYQSAEAGRIFPHLAWVRRFFVEQEAFLVDLGPAPADSGFLTGSSKRRRLYHEGRFHPPRTLVLWRRAALLAWAEAHPHLGENQASGRVRPATQRVRPPSPPPDQPTDQPAEADAPDAAPTFLSRLRHCFDGRTLLDTRPKIYIAFTLLLPASLVSISVFLIKYWWASPPCFALTFLLMWIVQYFLLQRPSR